MVVICILICAYILARRIMSAPHVQRRSPQKDNFTSTCWFILVKKHTFANTAKRDFHKKRI
nr:unnamed protein product [Callosobruchus analis]